MDAASLRAPQGPIKERYKTERCAGDMLLALTSGTGPAEGNLDFRGTRSRSA